MSRSRAAQQLDRVIRPARPITQKQLADDLGVTQQAVSAWLRGISRPDEKRRARIAELTGVDADGWDVDSDVDDSGAHLAVDNDTATAATGS